MSTVYQCRRCKIRVRHHKTRVVPCIDCMYKYTGIKKRNLDDNEKAKRTIEDMEEILVKQQLLIEALKAESQLSNLLAGQAITYMERIPGVIIPQDVQQLITQRHQEAISQTNYYEKLNSEIAEACNAPTDH